MIFVVFFILLMLMNSVKDFVFSDAFVVSPFQKSCCQVCGEFSTFDMTSSCDESSKMAFHGSLVSHPPVVSLVNGKDGEATASTSCRTSSAHGELA